MNIGLSNLTRKKESLLRIQIRAERSRQEWIRVQKKAEEDIENVVAFLVDTKSSTLTEVAKEMNCSRDKIKAMADRARKRNRELLRKGTG